MGVHDGAGPGASYMLLAVVESGTSTLLEFIPRCPDPRSEFCISACDELGIDEVIFRIPEQIVVVVVVSCVGVLKRSSSVDAVRSSRCGSIVSASSEPMLDTSLAAELRDAAGDSHACWPCI